MLHAYVADNNCLKRVEAGSVDASTIVWFDLHNPAINRSEEKFIEETLGIDVPTREEVNTLDLSSRLYLEDGAVFMTETILVSAEREHPTVVGITFILKAGKLVTLRYDDFPPLSICAERAIKPGNGFINGEAVLKQIVETTLDRIGDVLAGVGDEVDKLSKEIFEARSSRAFSNATFKSVLLKLGREEHIIAKVRDSLVNVGRLSVFAVQAAGTGHASADLAAFFRTEGRDIEALAQYVSHITAKVNFLLNATLGLVSIEQNQIIKIFSVAAVLFLPPTLIASIYGMNFKHMPELGWVWGYPMAVILMILSAMVPILIFRQRGWL